MDREIFRYSIIHKIDDNVFEGLAESIRDSFEEEISNCFSILITRANNLK